MSSTKPEENKQEAYTNTHIEKNPNQHQNNNSETNKQNRESNPFGMCISKLLTFPFSYLKNKSLDLLNCVDRGAVKSGYSAAL